MYKSKVLFTKTISPEGVIRLFDALDKELPGRVAVKLHSGEKGNQNYIRPEFWKPMIDRIGGRVVECNTAYPGARNHTKKHLKLLDLHGWTKYFDVDLMDAEGPDKILKIPNGRIIKQNYVGKNIDNYDSMLVLSHFKGHPAAGYGGAIKQLSIGCASTAGKSLIHSAGMVDDQRKVWRTPVDSDLFLESMADAASSIVTFFHGNLTFINVMANLSVDCDCCSVAEDPCMKDIGMLASTDPVAIDQACIDLILKSEDRGRDHFMKRVNSLNGMHTIEASEKMGFGSREYELIDIG